MNLTFRHLGAAAGRARTCRYCRRPVAVNTYSHVHCLNCDSKYSPRGYLPFWMHQNTGARWAGACMRTRSVVNQPYIRRSFT